MADITVPSKRRAPLRLLSLDGGGIRGISELLILNVIMHRVRRAKNLAYEPLPADYFDLMCGTSTGGLIAILLGRLRCSVSEAIDEYRTLAKYVFSAKNYIMKDNILKDGKFKAKKLEAAVKEVVKKKLGEDDARMLDSNSDGCKTFVCAMPAKHISKRPRLFRTYLTQNPGYDALKIWEAARATSAAPRFFEQITIGDPGLQEQFMDGGMGCNNPVRILVEEAGQEFDCEDKVACIISIGTGIPKVIAVDKPGFFQKVFPSQLIKALADITTSSESEAAAMEERYRSCPGLYHRLNVDRGLEEISLEEWEKLGDVKTHTEAYINDNPDVSRTIDKIVDALVGKETQNYTLGKLDGSVQPRNEEIEFFIFPSFRAVNYFIERKDILKDMTEYLEAPAVSSKPKVFVLQGMGGCGKSQLALEYCQRSRDKKTFGTILWIDATSPDTLQQSFTGVAKDMGKPEFNPTDPEINFRYVEKRLGVQQQNWLLIFDNFDDPKAFHGTIKKYFPQVTMGSIIITTRHLEVTSLGHSLEVTRMLFDEGMELLFQKSQVSRDDRSEKEASAIVSRLGFHALAIDQAGSYIFKRHLDIASYLTHFNSRRAKVLNEHPDFWDYRRPLKNGPDKETELTVFTTWELSFQLISGNELERKDKEHILTLMAFFNKNGLSDQMFIPYARKQKDWMISCRNKGTWDVYSFQDILVELRNLSLLQSLAIQESAIFSLHPLIQDWIKLRISPATRKLFAEQSMILLGDLMESSDLNITSFQAKNLLLGHLDAVLSNKDEYIPTVDFLASGDLLNAAYWFSDFLWLQGRSTQAEEMCRIVVDGKTELFGNADPNTLNAQGALSRLFLEQGKHSEAEQLCRELLAMEMKVLGTDNVETLRSMNCLSRILHSQGKYTEAEAQCRKTLMLQKKVLGREHSDTLQSMNALASLLQDQIRHGEAETIYREALAISKKRLGEENLSVFELMNNLAAALMQQDKLDEAEPLYREALALKQKAFGKDHLDVLLTMHNLAWLLEKRGKLDEAECLYRETLMKEIMLGKGRSQTLATIDNFACLLRDRGKFGEAEDLFRQARASFESVLGPNHPKTFTFLAHFARCLSEAGKYNEAEVMYRDVRPRYETVYGLDHNETLSLLLSFAKCLSDGKKYKEAEDIYRDAYPRCESLHGVDHNMTLCCLLDFATCLRDHGKCKEAENIFRDICPRFESFHGPNHKQTLTCLSRFGNCLYEVEKDDEADELWQLIREREKENDDELTRSAARTDSVEGNDWDAETALPLGRLILERTG